MRYGQAVAPDEGLVDLVSAAAVPFGGMADPVLARLADSLAAADVVCLGEATHGTAEFYHCRAALTRHLVERHGFTIVAAEADWPDAARIDRFVRLREGDGDGEPPFQRFPTWMWRNREVESFIRWLRGHNEGVAEPGKRVGVYGLDLYSLGGSIRAVLDYLQRVDPEAAAAAKRRYGCLTPFQEEPAAYGMVAMRRGAPPCEQAVLDTLKDLLSKRLDYMARDPDAFVDAQANARLVASAERYYRAMYDYGEESWNLRDTHMVETLAQVLAARGPGAKAVVWAHNSHLGDCRATQMGRGGQVNVGQLCRERFGEGAVRLVGFGTDRGTVAAADDWDGPVRFIPINPARDDSYEGICAHTGHDRFHLDLSPAVNPEAVAALHAPRLERAIGVIYRPDTERQSHYFTAELSRQFDHWLWFAETTPVTPLADEHGAGALETWPFGV